MLIFLEKALGKVAGLFVGNLLEKNFSEMEGSEKVRATVRVVAIPTLAILIIILSLKGGNDILINRLVDVISSMVGGI